MFQTNMLNIYNNHWVLKAWDNTINIGKYLNVDPGGRAVYGVGMQSFDCWDREFESRWGHGYSSLVFVVCCVGSGLYDRLRV